MLKEYDIRWDIEQRNEFQELTTFDETTDIFINAIVNKYKELEVKKISEKSIRELASSISQIAEDVNEIRHLNYDIAKGFENYIRLKQDLEEIRKIIDKYKKPQDDD